jgi:hypothetical protein
MIPNEKIIMFMQAKNDYLKENGCKIKYFLKSDEKEILSWDENEAQGIWNFFIKKKKFFSGISCDNCPFCIYNDYDCDICGYSKRHKKCYYENSTASKISNFFEKIYISTNDLPDNKFYKKLINRIENKGE